MEKNGRPQKKYSEREKKNKGWFIQRGGYEQLVAEKRN